MVDTETSWEKARNLAEVVASILPKGVRIKVGPFLYDSSNRTYFYSFRHQEDERLKAISAQAVFALGEIPGPGLFSRLAVTTPDFGTESLLSNSITQDGRLPNSDYFPSFEYRWRGGVADPNDKGSLVFMRIDLDGDTFVNFYLGKEPHVAKRGDEMLLSDIPNSIEGVAEILSRPIPWKIDYDQYAEEILKRSQLEQFHAIVMASL